jgi:hypothetical protein
MSGVGLLRYIPLAVRTHRESSAALEPAWVLFEHAAVTTNAAASAVTVKSFITADLLHR